MHLHTHCGINARAHLFGVDLQPRSGRESGTSILPEGAAVYQQVGSIYTQASDAGPTISNKF